MGYRIVWNKKKTKIKIWSTISDGYVTNFEKPEDLTNYYEYGDLVKEQVFGICGNCNQKLPLIK